MQPKHMTQTTQVYHLPLVALLEQMHTAQATLSLSTILLLGTREEARMLRPRLRGGQFKVTHLVHLGSSASAMTVRLM